eukprot:CAMPEP_0201875730 /NCGR_PEP_ID=MMETSP0902-20130614/7621_1 /ASSEMBLY_ACC=CAM_ASM_000551 /TAXON_ID=420261 /ORGANISM="Thalassiosira antarctica, Strain CCMP982" /LENGTH=309 /DNA_ID=CAMNT_0048402835 /DNA_START=35 /DNA_END=964 /DNA_ORIENTATION=+
MTSNQHYDYDDDSTSHLQQQPQHHRNNPHDHHDNNHDTNSFQETFDPCQAYTNKACIEACQAMSSVDHVCGGVGVWDSDKLSKYFNRNQDEDGEGLDHHSSPYLYSPSAPVGPSSCEYCGKRNTEECTSNLPREFFDGYGINGGLDRNGNSNNTNLESSPPTKQRNNNNDEDDEEVVCLRPKLFFLKKRPPFATPEGWNPDTEYRMNLFEPPSSAEGNGRGWGEVRGHLGNNGGGPNYNASANTNNPNRRYEKNGCGSSVCGGAAGGAETEVSFSSAGDRGTNVSASDGGRSLSPVQWVSGLMGALSPS